MKMSTILVLKVAAGTLALVLASGSVLAQPAANPLGVATRQARR